MCDFLSLTAEDPRSASTSRDASHTRKKFPLRFIDASKDKIMLAHSYGGVVGGAAVSKLSRSAPSAEEKASGTVGFFCTLLEAHGPIVWYKISWGLIKLRSVHRGKWLIST